MVGWWFPKLGDPTKAEMEKNLYNIAYLFSVF